jgi:lipopolysaccharide export system permease protein
MKTIHKLIFKETVIAVIFVTLCFLSIFFFFDLIEELPNVGVNNNTYMLHHAFIYVALSSASHLYDLLPMTVLIGTIFVLSRLAQSSEFTILRTSGLDPLMMLRTLTKLGAIFVLITFAVGDYLAPLCDHEAKILQARHMVGNSTQAGSWLKETSSEKETFVKIDQVSAEGLPKSILILEFSSNGTWLSSTYATEAQINDGHWLLKQVTRKELLGQEKQTLIKNTSSNEIKWETEITSQKINATFLKPNRMQTFAIFKYIVHLKANKQSSLKFEIEFWKKIFYPLSCLVMIVLALPYAYLHFRSANIAVHVFGGVIIGISFFMSNNVFSHVGNINNWTPWLAAAAPGIIYSVIALGTFGWLVIRH